SGLTFDISKLKCQMSSLTPVMGSLARIPLTWQHPPFWYEHLYQNIPILPESNCVDTQAFESAVHMKRIVGILLHRAFKYLAENPALIKTPDLCDRFNKRWSAQLRTLCVAQSQMNTALMLLNKGLSQTIKDERGLWILTAQEQSQCEYALHSYANNINKTIIIDRTFVANNERWIIDYKTSLPIGDHEDFLTQDVPTHAAQLHYYAQVMQKIDNRPIRLGLYYPLISAWRELI
ncbi:MAG TPA: PD-(D/E)XK nuclease family protein, partial [Gammaproteobacteria bacterium]|nr:PD-(D/E)XK nuclease family protein [Gammaproteobacteria bacterium]